MKTIERSPKGKSTKSTAKKKIRPVVVTIEGELAATIREGAKQMGFRADTWARQCIRSGDLASSGSDEAKEYRLNSALHELRQSGRKFVEVLSDDEWKRRCDEKRAQAAAGHVSENDDDDAINPETEAWLAAHRARRLFVREEDMPALSRHSLDTGVPLEDLKGICLRAGLELLQKGELKISASPPHRRPISFPAETVKLLTELCEASGFGSVEKYAEEFLSEEILASLESEPGFPVGVPQIIAGSYQLESADFADMQAVVDRWNAKTGGVA